VKEASSLAACIGVFGDVRISDEPPIFVWTGRGSDGILDRILSNELLDQAVEHIPELA
jgi:hypothetical protein